MRAADEGSPTLRLAVGCAAALWVAAAVSAPLAASAGWEVRGLYELFGRVCHQDPERSFHLAGHALAVCHRCFGLYLGGWLGLVVALASPGARLLARRHGRLLLWLAAPMALDWALGAAGVHDLWWTRFGTGLLAALPAGLLLTAALDDLSIRRSPFSSAKGSVQ